MNCRQVNELLSSYIDGELRPEEMEGISEHLEKCSDCQKEYEALYQTVNQLRNMNDLEPPADFHDRFVNRLSKEKKKPLFTYWKSIGAAAAVLLILFVGFGLSQLPEIQMGKSNGGAEFESAEAPDSRPEEQLGEPSADQDEGLLPEGEADLTEQEEIRRENAPEGKGGGEAGFSIASQEENDGINDGEVQAGEAVEDIEELENKIIKNAILSIEVVDYGNALDKIIEVANSADGYVDNSDAELKEQEEKLTKGYEVIIKVPQETFDDVLANVTELGDTVEKKVITRDAVESYFRIKSRLSETQEKEQQLVNLLEKSEEEKEILRIEEELDEVRNDIEKLEKQLRYLKSGAAMSTINILVEEKGYSN
ncbi:MAG: DUF4349 domain-containing protein [bacterium]